MNTLDSRFYHKITGSGRKRCDTSSMRQVVKNDTFVATTEGTSAEGLAILFQDNVWKLHGLPESVISDREPQVAAKLTKELNRMLEIRTKLLMAFHPQTDGQTERIN